MNILHSGKTTLVIRVFLFQSEITEVPGSLSDSSPGLLPCRWIRTPSGPQHLQNDGIAGNTEHLFPQTDCRDQQREQTFTQTPPSSLHPHENGLLDNVHREACMCFSKGTTALAFLPLLLEISIHGWFAPLLLGLWQDSTSWRQRIAKLLASWVEGRREKERYWDPTVPFKVTVTSHEAPTLKVFHHLPEHKAKRKSLTSGPLGDTPDPTYRQRLLLMQEGTGHTREEHTQLETLF
ncbi:uncharacterized protein LOC104872467 [Fukomys damarensis]|uniref:uncharacterized protein LOC104872467 n=1 Tax=Fukomys damarensis TaxID=885580 RepID=UPI00053F4607|nr:uncharacterized protein LOC104872467 [Fukomys damarensis]